MKYNSLKLSGLLLAILLPCLVGAQDLMSKSFLKGEWTGYCVLEMISKSSTGFCKLCSLEFIEEKSTFKFNQTIIDFEESILKINRSGVEFQGAYEYSSDEGALTFEEDGEMQHYKVLLINEDKIILRDMDGRLMFLERKS